MASHSAADFDALVTAAAGGDQAALSALYRAYHPPLVRFLTGLVPGEAEDLAADAWIDVSRALSRFAGDGQDFRRLLFTIARRRAIDYGRKRQRRRTEPTDLLGNTEQVGGDDVADTVAELDASRRAVRQITNLLPRQQAEVILLRIVAGLSLADVAGIVGKSPGAVSVLQTRGLQRLAARIGDPARFARESEPR
ncbi:MAG: RNA polymerase sigma factor [Acidimicrobiales bacterium]